MNRKFDWKEQGLDRARFEALTKLLRLRHQGQVEPPTQFEDDGEQDDDAQGPDEMDCSSVKASPPTDLEAGRLRRRFLDRLAELIADQKGGRHVAATAMSVAPDRVKVTVAKNDKFRATDMEFLERVQSLLRQIATSTHDGGSKDALWAELRYQQDLDTPSRHAQPVPPALDSELGNLCVLVFGHHPSTASRNDALVTRAHAVYKMFSSGDFEDLDIPAGASLRTALGYLGRPRTSFHALVAAAEKLEGFANIEITALAERKADGARAKKAASAASEPWSVARIFRQLGQPLTDGQVQSLLGSNGKKAKWTRAKVCQEFDKLRSPTWEVHAEMKLLQHCIVAAPSGERMVPYFGCSKRSCFLCWSFLDIFQGFKTRGCHGKLYNLWGLPGFEGCGPEEMSKIVDTVRALEALLTTEILQGTAGALPLAKESTIGPSSTHTTMPTYERPGLTDTVLRYLDNQRLDALFQATERGTEDVAEDTATVSSVDKEIETSTETHGGHCGNLDCEKRTTRRCSRCHGGWYCSLSCEEADIYSHKFVCSRGAITTADILQRDCYADNLPEDPQVREDFGFTRCRNKTEESHLCGLYQGIFKVFDVTAAEMHSWRMEGILTGKIIETFSAYPEGSRGGYYPWFLRNRHVLDESHRVVRDEDDPELHVQRMIANARPYLSPSDQSTPVECLIPWAKQNCFIFLAVLLSSAHPPPTMPNLDLWYDFGFAVCPSPQSESSLANFYTQLLFGNRPIRDYYASLGSTHFMPADFPTCSFEQFWKAWEAGTLMDLFDTYGNHDGRAAYGESIDFQFPDLREFLSYPGGAERDQRFPRPSVWRLRQFLAVEGANVLSLAPSISRAAIEYGFDAGLNARTRLDLHAFYKRIFLQGVRTAEVDWALRVGRLHEMADQWYGEPVNERVRAVLRAVSEARRTVSGDVEDGSSGEHDTRDMSRIQYECDEGEGSDEEGFYPALEHLGGEDEITGREQSEPLGNETRGWCTIQ
ncbi:hypothetical protein QBC47DRAFT_355084 [Echria macrotheca]|uniref:MYND-type domain-containing protein n=1 Tax=Echria macrotheca TaxID=438768 RepID=A0AAJ0B4V2_9PEZI|nr:hypothetical protein QBC47DRAFT_355084 [Echria macrotheca]